MGKVEFQVGVRKRFHECIERRAIPGVLTGCPVLLDELGAGRTNRLVHWDYFDARAFGRFACNFLLADFKSDLCFCIA